MSSFHDLRRRILLVFALATALFIGSAGGALAQTGNYNFTFTASGGPGVLSGVFGVTFNGFQNLITAISGTGTGFVNNDFNGSIGSLIAPSGFGGNDNMFFVAPYNGGVSGYLDDLGVSFNMSVPLNLYYYGDNGAPAGADYTLGGNTGSVDGALTVSAVAAPAPLPGGGAVSWAMGFLVMAGAWLRSARSRGGRLLADVLGLLARLGLGRDPSPLAGGQAPGCA